MLRLPKFSLQIKLFQKSPVDPDEQTADVNSSNNSWPKNTETQFETFKKNQIKG